MSQKTEAGLACTIGIDTGKNTLHLVGLDAKGAVVLREKLARGRIAARLANVPPCLIGIEAGMATHYVARELLVLGHDVRQVPPAYAKPFRQGHKNDFRDAHAIAEAVQRPSTHCVPIKTDAQLELQALHRVRSRFGGRTAVINQIRSFLLERGITVRQGLRFLRQQLPQVLATRTDVLSPRMIRIIEDLSSDWRRLDERIEHVTEEIELLTSDSEACRQLMTVPGIGPIIASAMVAAIGNGAAFAKGRDFAAWLGLVPKQMSTGDRTILGRITKRGNRYLPRCSCRALASFCSDRPIGQNTALDLGSQLQPSACITMFWQPRSPTSWRGSPGRSWRRAAAMNGAQRPGSFEASGYRRPSRN